MTEFTNENYAYLNHLMTFAPLYRCLPRRTRGSSENARIKRRTTGITSSNTCARPIRATGLLRHRSDVERIRTSRSARKRLADQIEGTHLSLVDGEKVIGTHHAEYLYPLRSEPFKRKMRADRVFIQHGVLGTKNMNDQYGKFAAAFDTDLFLVSSEREKRLVTQDMGYAEREVKITGLSRFDALLKRRRPSQTSDARHSDMALVVTDATPVLRIGILSAVPSVPIE